jgi:hypothetical protein
MDKEDELDDILGAKTKTPSISIPKQALKPPVSASKATMKQRGDEVHVTVLQINRSAESPETEWNTTVDGLSKLSSVSHFNASQFDIIAKKVPWEKLFNDLRSQVTGAACNTLGSICLKYKPETKEDEARLHRFFKHIM